MGVRRDYSRDPRLAGRESFGERVFVGIAVWSLSVDNQMQLGQVTLVIEAGFLRRQSAQSRIVTDRWDITFMATPAGYWSRVTYCVFPGPCQLLVPHLIKALR